MSAFAMLHLKYPSLLSFEREKSEPLVRHNLKHLYYVKNKAPCDTSMREIIVPQDPADFKKPYKLLLSEVQRAGLLKSFEFRIGSLKNHYLLAIDGTGIFHTSNNKKPCQECCTKNKGKTNEAHYHQMMAACIVHPEQKTVLPLASEAIVLQDGASKNDCEKTAIKRLFSTIKKNHPRLKFVILLDGLYPNEIKMRVTNFECYPERLSIKAYGAALDSHLPASSRALGIYPNEIKMRVLTSQNCR